jgi:uncharacterized protein (UPF0276 family)
LATRWRSVFRDVSIPSQLLNQWENERAAWLRVHPEPWSAEIEREYHQRFSSAIEQWLDAGHGVCLLRKPGCAQIVAETLLHFDGIPRNSEKARLSNNEFVLWESDIAELIT